MNEPIINPEALIDLDDIWFYIGKDSMIAADREIDLIYASIARLAEHPESGHTREDLTELPLRFWTLHSYLIIYRADVEPIEIVRVLSGYRDIPTILGP